MSSNAFERKVAAVLAKDGRCWLHHPADVMGSSKRRLPGDFIWGCGIHWGLLECKETAEPRLLPKEGWPAHQRAAARAVVAAGGVYGLAVRFPSRDLLFVARTPASGAWEWEMDRVRVDHPLALRLLRLEDIPDILLAP